MISGGIAGLWGGLTNMRTYASATAGVTALPVYICDDLSNVRNAFICIVIALVSSFVLTLLFGVPKSEDTSSNSEVIEADNTKLNKYTEISSCMNGKVVPLENVEDDVFSKKIMGPGVAILPSEGKVYAPFDGVVNTVFPTKHAYGLTSVDGIEAIIHLGLDTVNLEGKYFEAKVKSGQSVKRVIC
ncbi:MAG: glucose PTS transporter subunit IIA [Holdemanella porci]